MQDLKRDHLAVSIADYEGLKAEERGLLLGRIMEDQPMLMGFLTNLADDFTDSEHEVLVDSAVILINAFVGVGIPIKTMPDPLIKEVIEEKVSQYEDNLQRMEAGEEELSALSDSPVVFEDLRNRALFKSDLSEASAQEQHNFLLVLEAVLAMVERMASLVIAEKENDEPR